MSAIEQLYREWATMSRGDWDMLAEIERETRLADLRHLQEQIRGANPTSPRDVALQFWCDTDDGLSEHSRTFEDRMRQLAGDLAPKPWEIEEQEA